MNIFQKLFIKTLEPSEADLEIAQRKPRLADTLKPRPDLRDRRFATWSMERRQRYLDAVFGTPQSLRNRGKA